MAELDDFKSLDDLADKRVENKIKRGRRLTEKEIQSIVIGTLHLGMSNNEMAKQIKCHRSTVIRWKGRLGIKKLDNQ